MKIWKIFIKIGVGLLIFVGIVLAVRAVLNFTEGRALAKTLAGLKAKGIPLTAKDLAAPCSDEDNAARLWKAFENTTTIPGRQTFAPGRTPRKSRDTEIRGLISRAWTDFTAGKPLAPADRAALKDAVLKNERAFALLAEMGDKPCFLYRDPAKHLFESPMPDAIQMIQATKLLLFSSLFSAEDGDIHGAVNKLITGLKFAPLVAGEGAMMSYLIALADTGMLAQPLGEICRGRAVKEEDLVRLMAALDPSPWRGRLAAAFRGERVMCIEVGRDVLGVSFEDLGSVFEGPRWRRNLEAWLVRPLIKKDLRQSLPDFEFLEAQAKLPYYQCRDALRARDQALKERPWYAFLSRLIISDAEASFMKTAKTEAITLASRAGLACRLYKSRTGRYPESLDELVPGLLTEVPIDPFTGKPFIYRQEGEGFIVYSLGSNQKDDGGRSTYMITQLVMPKDDDWSWRENR